MTDAPPRLKVTALETIQLAEFPNLVWLRVHTDAGLVGLGETFFGAKTVAAYIHESVAPYILGKPALDIDLHSRRLYGYVGFNSTGAEARGNSALDLALWDLFGKATGLPVYQLLGGASRDRLRIYNTCAGYRYVRARPAPRIDNGYVYLPDGPGLGTDLLPGLESRPDATVRISKL